MLRRYDFIKIILIGIITAQQKQSVMSAKKKQSNISEPTTQPERPRRFVRRNSFHTIHCRSGSLNKLGNFSQELPPPLPEPHTPQPQKRHRHQNVEIDTLELLQQFNDGKDIAMKRGSGSMKIKACCKQKDILSEQYDKIKRQYQIRGQQIQALEEECLKMRKLAQEQNIKRKNLEEEMRLSKLELKRLEKRSQKYKLQRQQLQKQRQNLLKHIQSLEQISFGQQVLTLQSYRQKVLEDQVKKLREQLQKSRSQREQQLLVEVEKMSSQKYNLQSLNSRQNMANNVLQKQLEESQQCYEQLQLSIGKAVTSSVEYIELRERYKQTLVQMRQMRREILQLQRSREQWEERAYGAAKREKNSFSNTILQVSQSIVLELQQ